MRIVVATTSYPRFAGDPGGHFVATEVSRYVDEGHHVRVLLPGPQRGGKATRSCPGNPSLLCLPGAQAFGWPGVLTRLQHEPWHAPQLGRFVWALRRALASCECDTLLAHWLLPVLPLILPARIPATTAVVHGSDARLVLALPRPLGRHLLQRLMDRGVRFRFVSQALRDELGEVLPALGGEEVVPAALVVPEISRQGLRERLGLAADAFVAVSVGRLVSGKRVAVALQRAPVPDGSQWVVVGDGPLDGQLRAQFPHARFTGALPREEALAWIAASDVLVNASLHEGAPTTIREARALGTKVWSSAVGDVPSWAAQDPGIMILPELG
jgi:glycosyltransferase involved in cell wall biosynthesis